MPANRQLTGALRSHLATAGRIIGVNTVVWHIPKTRKVRGPDGSRLKEPKWFLLAHPATKVHPDLWWISVDTGPFGADTSVMNDLALLVKEKRDRRPSRYGVEVHLLEDDKDFWYEHPDEHEEIREAASGGQFDDLRIFVASEPVRDLDLAAAVWEWRLMVKDLPDEINREADDAIEDAWDAHVIDESQDGKPLGVHARPGAQDCDCPAWQRTVRDILVSTAARLEPKRQDEILSQHGFLSKERIEKVLAAVKNERASTPPSWLPAYIFDRRLTKLPPKAAVVEYLANDPNGPRMDLSALEAFLQTKQSALVRTLQRNGRERNSVNKAVIRDLPEPGE